MRIAWAIVAIFCARFLVAAWFYPGQDGDLAWQQWLGLQVLHAHHLPTHLGPETFTSDGARWVPQEWAFSLAVAATLPNGHFGILALVTTLAAALALFLTAVRSYRRGASTFAIALTTLCTGFAMLQSFGVRAQIFGWAAFAIILLLLDVEGPAIFLAIPIVALWANIHASALVAPAIVGAWSFGTWIEDRAWTERVERNFVLTLGCAFAVFLTPLFWQLPVYAVGLETSFIRSAIAEWQPSDILFTAFSAGVLPLIAICAYFGIAAPRERWRDGMMFALVTIMAFIAVRHLPLAALAIAPMAAARLTSVLPAQARINAILNERFSETLVFAASAFSIVVIVVSLSKVPAIAGVALPRTAVTTLSGTQGVHNLYCEDFAWCSLALAHPNLRTFVDGRCDPFPPRVWQDYLDVERVSPRWTSVLDRYSVDAVLVKDGRPLAQALALRSGWRVFYHDAKYEIFLRDGVRTADR
ncbi:MAG TPA: hypothetical protein VGZ02_00940 [Candidatus Baltobacteraceae bacterium]|jgi:hypothetical protein|nr:hypothetical protein [Candidatus Baltobacteraceae bacterium]